MTKFNSEIRSEIRLLARLTRSSDDQIELDARDAEKRGEDVSEFLNDRIHSLRHDC